MDVPMFFYRRQTMIYNKNKIEAYSEKISITEKEQCERAIDMVKDALTDYGYKLTKTRENFSDDGYAYFYKMSDSMFGALTIIIQGSFANNTNIKRYSDVDISVVFASIFSLNLYSEYLGFKTKIYNALRDKFGTDVIRKNKSIKVYGNSSRKSIDVVAAFSINNNLENGIQFLTEKGDKIINYPLKQIQNENVKHRKTNYMFKKYVRIIKNIKEDMAECGYKSADHVGSFQIESLLWNLNDSVFTEYASLVYGVNCIISELYKNKYMISSYLESNGLKKLCPDEQTKNNIQNFIIDLYGFYESEV